MPTLRLRSTTLPRTGAVAASERGVVMIYAVLGLLLVAGIVVTGGTRNQALQTASSVEFSVEGLARQVAESGIVDALAWLRLQPEQPVAEFRPRRDPTASPPLDETDDPDIGLVREFEISRGYWGRYVVRRGSPAEEYTDTNKNGVYDAGEPFDDADGDGRRTPASGTLDISARRGEPREGTVWYLEGEGSVYRRVESDKALGEGRNHRLARVDMGCEVRRLAFVLPASAAIVIADGDKAKLRGIYINSPVLGIGYRPGNKAPKYTTKMGDQHRLEFDAPAEHAAVPGWISDSGVKDADKRIRPEDVFGVSMETLRAMADYNIESLGDLPAEMGVASDKITEEMQKKLKKRAPYTIPHGALVVITPPEGKKVVFDGKQSLVGYGIVVIDGDLEVKGQAAQFEGILYVTGKMNVEKGGSFNGITIAGTELDVHGHLPENKVKKVGKKQKSGKPKSVKAPPPDESVHFGHDPALVARLTRELGRYRRWKSSYRPVRVHDDERPDELYRTDAALSLQAPKK